MPRFRSKPVEITAEQFLSQSAPPKGMTLWPTDEPIPRDMSWGYVTTIHGQRAHVQHGDWIVPEPDGVHYYPVKPDIFSARYQPADESSERFTGDEIKAINQAAAYLGGVLSLSTFECAALSSRLFEIAGNPIEQAAS